MKNLWGAYKDGDPRTADLVDISWVIIDIMDFREGSLDIDLMNREPHGLSILPALAFRQKAEKSR